jgi:hypothetical protein
MRTRLADGEITTAYYNGYVAGYEDAQGVSRGKVETQRRAPAAKKRKASEYAKKYGKAFKRIAPKYKKKSGGWKAGGFKAAQKAAHKMAKRMR